MKIFLSHARKDAALAHELAGRLTRGGFTVWMPDEEIEPGENWAKKTGKALDDADLMIVLLTPKARESDLVRENIEYAIMSQKFAGRVFTVFVGPAAHASKAIPWILRKLPHVQVESSAGFREVVKALDAFLQESIIASHA